MLAAVAFAVPCVAVMVVFVLDHGCRASGHWTGPIWVSMIDIVRKHLRMSKIFSPPFASHVVSTFFIIIYLVFISIVLNGVYINQKWWIIRIKHIKPSWTEANTDQHHEFTSVSWCQSELTPFECYDLSNLSSKCWCQIKLCDLKRTVNRIDKLKTSTWFIYSGL